MIARTSLVYGMVAGFCLCLNNGIIIGMDWLGAPLIAGVALSFGLVTGAGYVLHSMATFRRAIGWVGLGRYALAMSANVPLSFVTIWLWHAPVGLPMIYAAPMASACMIAMNFALSHWAIGRHRGLPRADGPERN